MKTFQRQRLARNRREESGQARRSGVWWRRVRGRHRRQQPSLSGARQMQVQFEAIERVATRVTGHCGQAEDGVDEKLTAPAVAALLAHRRFHQSPPSHPSKPRLRSPSLWPYRCAPGFRASSFLFKPLATRIAGPRERASMSLATILATVSAGMRCARSPACFCPSARSDIHRCVS